MLPHTLIVLPSNFPRMNSCVLQTWPYGYVEKLEKIYDFCPLKKGGNVNVDEYTLV